MIGGGSRIWVPLVLQDSWECNISLCFDESLDDGFIGERDNEADGVKRVRREVSSAFHSWQKTMWELGGEWNRIVQHDKTMEWEWNKVFQAMKLDQCNSRSTRYFNTSVSTCSLHALQSLRFQYWQAMSVIYKEPRFFQYPVKSPTLF